MKKIILIIGILALLVSCDMPNNDSSNTDVSNQTDTTSETTNKEDETPSPIEDEPTSPEENEENGNETPSPIEDEPTSESEETNYSNEFIVSSDVTWEEIDGNVDSDYVSYVHYNNNDDYTQRIKEEYGVQRDMSTKEFLYLNVTVTIHPSNTSSWIRTNLTIYFMENDELKFISSTTSILIENVYINKENKEVHIYLIDKN